MGDVQRARLMARKRQTPQHYAKQKNGAKVSFQCTWRGKTGNCRPKHTQCVMRGCLCDASGCLCAQR